MIHRPIITPPRQKYTTYLNVLSYNLTRLTRLPTYRDWVLTTSDRDTESFMLRIINHGGGGSNNTRVEI